MKQEDRMKLEDIRERLRLARAALQKNQGSVELENNVRAWERAVRTAEEKRE